jgi:hypothetical protein
VHSSIPPAFPRAANHWHPGDELNDEQAFLLTLNASLSTVALAAYNPPDNDTALGYAFPVATIARPRAALRLIRGGRK